MLRTSNKLLMTGLVLSALLSSQGAFAYGTSSSSNACKKPKFSNFKPPHKAVVQPGADFSFTVSRRAGANTITVKVKNIDVPVNVDTRNNIYIVKGKLPEGLESGAYSRINLRAKTLPGGCKGSGGWLVKIAE